MSEPGKLGSFLPASMGAFPSRKAPDALASSTDETLAAMATSIFQVGFAMNVEQSKDRIRVLSEILYAQGWTAHDVGRAAAAMMEEPELMQSIRYAGAITPEPFALWRRKNRPAAKLVCVSCGEKLPGMPEVIIEGRIVCEDCYRPTHQTNEDHDRTTAD